jgi:hypothetical protein
MTAFLFGLFVGVPLGALIMGLTVSNRVAQDRYLDGLIMRVMQEGTTEAWPYRVESYWDEHGSWVRSFYDEEGRIHHTDKGIAQGNDHDHE